MRFVFCVSAEAEPVLDIIIIALITSPPPLHTTRDTVKGSGVKGSDIVRGLRFPLHPRKIKTLHLKASAKLSVGGCSPVRRRRRPLLPQKKHHQHQSAQHLPRNSDSISTYPCVLLEAQVCKNYGFFV